MDDDKSICMHCGLARELHFLCAHPFEKCGPCKDCAKPANRAGCQECGDVIESTDRHDYKTCSCGNISVDGGGDYFRRLWKDSRPVQLSCDADVEDFAQEYERRHL